MESADPMTVSMSTVCYDQRKCIKPLVLCPCVRLSFYPRLPSVEFHSRQLQDVQICVDLLNYDPVSLEERLTVNLSRHLCQAWPVTFV